MTFKEAYEEDLENTFFDAEEFASEHTVDGKTMVVVVMDSEMEDNRMVTGARRSPVNPKETAVNRSNLTLYIQEKDVERKLTVNSMINLDGKKLFVQEVHHFDGVYKLKIGAHGV